jgi:hypothetical protein
MKRESKTLVERYLYRTLDSVDQHLVLTIWGLLALVYKRELYPSKR